MLKSKLPDLGTTIFTIMSQLANEHKAINLAQGFPDFPCSPRLTELVSQYMNRGWNQYAPMTGVQVLRERIAEKTEVMYGFTPDVTSEITVTCGATEACYVAITSIVRPGDEVIIFEPAFDCYLPAIQLSGGKVVPVELDAPEYRIPWDKVKEKLSPATRLIIVNSPHNPTGSALTKEDIAELKNVVKGTDIVILSDEVYEHIIFDDREHESVLNDSELRERAFVISSFGKTFHTTGWRIGYCIAPRYLSAEFRKVHQYITFSAPTPMQFAIADFLADKEHYMELPEFYQKKRDLFLTFMKESRFEALPSAGTYFQLLSYRKFSEEKDTDLAKWLTKEAGVACIPISVFYTSGKDDKLLRFCFAKEDITLEKAAEKLCRI
jgi:methionine transaminase